MQLRAARIAVDDRDAPAVVTLTRPRGYFGIPRDEIELDGSARQPGIPAGVAGVSTAKARLADAGERPGLALQRERSVVGRSWPTAATTWCCSNCTTGQRRRRWPRCCFPQGFGTRRECESW